MSKSISANAKTPDAALAAAIARDVVGDAPISVRRFTNGLAHYVFDVAFADRPPIVVRIGDASAQTSLAGALYLSGFLRPRGMPLPAILASDAKAEFPWIAMERLPGADLGDVIADLSPDAIEPDRQRSRARPGHCRPNRVRGAIRLRHPARAGAASRLVPRAGG